jgi:uncharacterized Ntn-hydrolase superfamily protein
MTYSIAARCPRTGAFGIAITSSSICVASRCAWVSPTGAVLTQNITDPALGPLGLSLVAKGKGARDVVKELVAATPYSAWRQLAAVDREGRTAAHSGARALPIFAEAHGAGCVAVGNILANDGVPRAMIEAFALREADPLPERLLRSLEAGLAQGGETADEHAAGLHVCDRHVWPVVDLRVDWHDDPIVELRRAWTAYAPQMDAYITRAVNPAAAPAF